MEDKLEKASGTLRSGVLKTEAQVRAAVISPILQALGWDPADPDQWRVEWPVKFDVGVGYVDDALFGPGGTALVFVEAKRPGNLDPDAEEQLFRYAANKGVPILVLTDGDIWDLYLSMAADERSKRRFAHLTLTKSNDLTAIATDLQRYLSRDRVVKGNAKASAEQRLADDRAREQGRKALSAAWNGLLAEPDELLRDSLIERVEQATGSRPWHEDAEEFLRTSATQSHQSVQQNDAIEWLRAAPANLPSRMKATVQRWLKQVSNAASNKPSPDGSAPEPPSGQGNLRGFRFRGVDHPTQNGWETLTTLASVLEQHKPGFLNELAQHGTSARKWPRAVRHDEQLMQTKADGPSYRPVDGHADWLLLVHGSTRSKLRWMKQMTELAGLVWTTDVEPLFENPST